MSNRPNLGFGDDDDSQISNALDPLDLSSFQPQPVRRPDKQVIQEAAAKAQFKSREAAIVPAATVPIAQSAKTTRRRRTGRSAQLNIKCRPETIEQFYNVADSNGWGLGEAFEKAVMLLQKNENNKS